MAGMRFSHLHVSVWDLPEALEWLARVWDIQPTFQNGGGMAEVSVHGVSLILDAADEDSPVTVGFSSDDCDEDYRFASERGAEGLEAPTDRPGASAPPTYAARARSRSRSNRPFPARADAPRGPHLKHYLVMHQYND